jgi:hypothetical protein
VTVALIKELVAEYKEGMAELRTIEALFNSGLKSYTPYNDQQTMTKKS